VCEEVRSRTDIATGQISVSVRAWILAVSPSLGAAQRVILGLPPPVSKGSHVQPGS
jgi:hypothetical protein